MVYKRQYIFFFNDIKNSRIDTFLKIISCFKLTDLIEVEETLFIKFNGMKELSLQKILTAKKALRGKILETPLLTIHSLTTQHGNPILVKAECLQPSGSFSIRGATFFLSKLTAAQRKHGVVTYSTGNHAQAVAHAAHKLHIPVTVVMSKDAPDCKIRAIQQYGAKIIFTEPLSDVRKRTAEDLSKSNNLVLIPPYDHVNIIAGQGTTGLEIMDQIDPAAIFVSIGGGALIAGVALAAKKMNPKVKIIGVEPELENDAWQSFKYHTKITLQQPSNTIVDAVRIQTLGNITYPIMKKYVDEIITLSEEDIVKATLNLIERTHLLVEPAGALAYAAALNYKKKFTTKKPVVAIASGGNTNLEFISKLHAKRCQDQ